MAKPPDSAENSAKASLVEIAGQIDQAKTISVRDDHQFLTYLLEMAAMEIRNLIDSRQH